MINDDDDDDSEHDVQVELLAQLLGHRPHARRHRGFQCFFIHRSGWSGKTIKQREDEEKP